MHILFSNILQQHLRPMYLIVTISCKTEEKHGRTLLCLFFAEKKNSLISWQHVAEKLRFLWFLLQKLTYGLKQKLI